LCDDDKVVTGASDGIGREFAIQLARAGFNVLLAARNQAKLDAVVDDIGAPVFFCLPTAAAHAKNQNFCCIYSYTTSVKACGGTGSGVQTKTFVVDFARADDAKWEALLEELKPIEVGVLGAYSFSPSLAFFKKRVLPRGVVVLLLLTAAFCLFLRCSFPAKTQSTTSACPTRSRPTLSTRPQRSSLRSSTST